MFSGVNDASGSIRDTVASMGVVGAESRYTRAGWPTRTRPICALGTNAAQVDLARSRA